MEEKKCITLAVTATMCQKCPLSEDCPDKYRMMVTAIDDNGGVAVEAAASATEDAAAPIIRETMQIKGREGQTITVYKDAFMKELNAPFNIALGGIGFAT